jgi:hypothetical protein
LVRSAKPNVSCAFASSFRCLSHTSDNQLRDFKNEERRFTVNHFLHRVDK